MTRTCPGNMGLGNNGNGSDNGNSLDNSNSLDNGNGLTINSCNLFISDDDDTLIIQPDDVALNGSNSLCNFLAKVPNQIAQNILFKISCLHWWIDANCFEIPENQKTTTKALILCLLRNYTQGPIICQMASKAREVIHWVCWVNLWTKQK